MERAAVHDVAFVDVALDDMERATVGDVLSWAWCLRSLLNTIATPNSVIYTSLWLYSVIYTSLLDSGAFICRGVGLVKRSDHLWCCDSRCAVSLALYCC